MIEFEKASFGYAGAMVVDGVDLILAPGSLHFLTGRSGAGKTTLLRLVFMALRPTAGAVRVLGADAAALNRREAAALRRRMGVVLQECDLIDHMTVRENIGLPLRIAGERPADFAADIAELGAWVGLKSRMDAYPPALSSGERQRAAIARAVVASPDLVVADEPTGNVDNDAAARIMSLFLELNRLGKTVLIATHDLDLMRAARGEAAHILRIENGAVERSGSPL